METGAITSHIDVAQVVLYAFWIFFAGLLIYLQRESRREGYPLVSEIDGRPMNHGVFMPDPKTFLLADGTTVTVPQLEKDLRQPPLEDPTNTPGFPFHPVGNPMTAGVGAGAYTPRAKRPDMLFNGEPRILPLRAAHEFYLETSDPDPRGMPVYGADWTEAGTIADVWIDRAEFIARYFEVELPGGVVTPPEEGAAGTAMRPLRVLLPVNFTQINSMAGRITVNAILAQQFADVPVTADPDLVTLDEEERICAYYGAGYLYATPRRQETLL
jgi:photosynthetic reaction center H subunit